MSSFRKKEVEKKYQPKGEPKDGRKVSKPKVTEDDELSSAHKNEAFRKGHKPSSGGRA